VRRKERVQSLDARFDSGILGLRLVD